MNGVIDQDVDFAPTRDNGLDRGPDGTVRADVEWRDQRLAAVITDCRRDRFRLLALIMEGNRNPRALAPKISAAARPIPRELPVTKATRSFKPRSMVDSLSPKSWSNPDQIVSASEFW